MLYLPQFFVFPLQLLLVDPIALHFGHGALVEEVEHCTVDLWAEIVVVLKELELVRGVNAEQSGAGEGGCLEGLNVLMGISVYHAVNQGVFSVFDVFCRFEFAARETNVERDVVGPFIQCVAWRDLRSWSIIFPSNPQVSLFPFVSSPSNIICSWW